jgi:hypothetical protein
MVRSHSEHALNYEGGISEGEYTEMSSSNTFENITAGSYDGTVVRG